MVKLESFFEIPRDNLFHACLLIGAIIDALEKGFEAAQFEERTLAPSRFEDDMSSVIALLVDTLSEEANKGVAQYLLETLKIAYEDGYIFDPASCAQRTDEPRIRIPKKVFLDAFAYLAVYDRQDTEIDLGKLFPNKETHHIIRAQIHGALYLKECLATLSTFINKSAQRRDCFLVYKAAHQHEIVVDIWDIPET